MPVNVDDTSRPTGDIFTDERRREANASQSSQTGTAYPRTSQQAGPKGFGTTVPITGSRMYSTSLGSIYSDRAADLANQPRIFSRDTLGTDLSTGTSRRYVGSVNIGAGDSRRTYGFRTNANFERAQRAVSERNRRVAAIRMDAARRGISLKEADDMNNRKQTLSLGQKVMQKAGTRLEDGDKKKKAMKRNRFDNNVPRAKQRQFRKMVPPGTYEKKQSFGQSIVETKALKPDFTPGKTVNTPAEGFAANLKKRKTPSTFGEKILAQAGTQLESGQKGEVTIRPDSRTRKVNKYGYPAVDGALGGVPGTMLGGATKKGRIIGAAAGAAGGAGLGVLEARARNKGRRYAIEKKSQDTDSFGKTVIDQARALAPQE